MKILITGGAGFIGSWLVESLIEAGREVIVVDNLSPQIHGELPKPEVSWLQSGHPQVSFVRGDVRDLAIMDPLLAQCDTVVHLAAETGTGQSMYQITHYYDVNHQATAAVFEGIATKHRHIRKVILASSRSIYGEGAYSHKGALYVPAPRSTEKLSAGIFEPTTAAGEALTLVATPEDATPYPASVYAATKLANETLGRIFSEAYGVEVVALRFQNVYGERQSLKNPYTGILSIFSNRMRQNLPINIFEDGKESRDFVHVSNVVAAIELALARQLQGFHAINVGSGVATSVLEVAASLRDKLKSQSELKVTGDFRTGDIRHCYADLNRANDVLGYSPSVSVDQGLQKFCDWVSTQPIANDLSSKAMSELERLGLSKASSAAK